MKGIYSKPMLTVEFFSLAQSIARDCGTSIPKDQLTFADPGNCVWETGSGRVFVELPNCNIPGENMGYGCYNNPGEGQYVFRS